MRVSSRLAQAIALIILLALGLSACVRTGRDVSINADGSGAYALTIGVKKQVLESIGASFGDSMSKFQQAIAARGGTTRQYDDATYTYWEFRRTFKTISELNDELGVNPGATGQINSPTSNEQIIVRQQEDFLTTSFHVAGTLDFGSSDAANATTASIFADAKEWLAITMPGWVTSHQGGTVTGNTVRWELRYGDKAAIDEVGGGYNSPHVALISGAVGMGLVATLGTGLWLALRRRRKPTLSTETAWPAT
ncbi:MAG TPA: hypothetical protein VF807_14720 [Ktedonobacterales bacterium]